MSMLNNELIEFIRGRRQAGTKDDEIKRLLMQQGGWSEFDINEAIKMIDSENKSTPSPVPQNPEGITANSIQKPAEPYRTAQNNAPESWTPRNSVAVSGSVRKFTITKILIIVVILAIVILGFVYSKNISSLISSSGSVPFTEQNMISGVFEKAKTVESTKYTSSVSVVVKDRDKDAKPMVIPKVDPKIEEAYKRDYKSYQNIYNILDIIERQRRAKLPLPNDLKSIVDLYKKGNSGGSLKIIDENGKPYIYTLSSDKKHASLTVSFESQEMLEKIKNHYLAENKIYTEYSKKNSSEKIDPSLRIIPNIPIIKDNQVTFDETAGFVIMYLYTDKYPESILKTYAMYIKQVPENTNASLKATGTYQKSKLDTISDFETSLDLKALFAMTNFSAGFDIKKTGPIYFARVRDFPDLSYFSAIKSIQNKWIKFDTTTKYSDQDRGMISQYASSLSEMKSSTSTREYSKAASDSFNKLIAIAEKNNLFGLRNSVSSEKYNGITVFRYDVKINMDKIPAVLEDLSKIDGNYASAYYSLLLNLKQDQTPEFKDYIENNVFLTLWVDSSGIIQKSQFKIRFVPPEDQVGFVGKQLEFAVDLALENVNEKINIVAPDKSITPAEADKLIEDNQSPSVKAKSNDAMVIRDLSQIRTLAESGFQKNYSSTLSYNDSSTTHGAGIKSAGDAKKILDASKANGSTIYAITDKNITSYALYGKLSSSNYYCIDSTGKTVTETSNKTKLTCTK